MIEKVVKVLTEIQKEEKTFMGSNYYLEDREDEVVIDMTINKEEFDKKWKELKC